MGRVSEARAYGAASVLLWSSGLFARDGGGNIVGMGAQRFAYDAAGRLTAARVEPQATNTPAGAHYDITYAYDAFGNMTARTGVGFGATIPAGFDFSRSFGGTPSANRNQVVGLSAWEYDESGNIVRQPGTYIPGGMANVWDASSRITAVFNGNPADPLFDARVAPAERYLYGADGLRMVTLQDGTDGKAVISLRDTDGKVVSEWEEIPGAAAPTKTKDYVWALGQQLVERTHVTSAPAVNAIAPFGSASGYGFQASAPESATSYLADIRTDGGYRQAVSGIVPNGAGGFWLPESAFLANATNYIRIRAEGADGAAYSAPVTFSHDPNVNGSSASQVKAIAISRVGTNVVVRWMLNQDNQKKFRIWYRRIDSGALILISPPAGLSASTREFSIASQGLQSNCGRLGVTQINTGGTETSSLEADLPGTGINDVGDNDPCEEPPIPPNPPTTIVVNVYHHRDHLGSTRVVTDSAGWPSEQYDYFPYGRQMVTDGSPEEGRTTFRFTGHERRAYVGQDYMFARVKATNEVMFASPDPIVDADAFSPTSWNRYGYTTSSPVQRVDPSGLSSFEPWKVAQDGYFYDVNGMPVSFDAVDWTKITIEGYTIYWINKSYSYYDIDQGAEIFVKRLVPLVDPFAIRFLFTAPAGGGPGGAPASGGGPRGVDRGGLRSLLRDRLFLEAAYCVLMRGMSEGSGGREGEAMGYFQETPTGFLFSMAGYVPGKLQARQQVPVSATAVMHYHPPGGGPAWEWPSLVPQPPSGHSDLLATQGSQQLRPVFTVSHLGVYGVMPPFENGAVLQFMVTDAKNWWKGYETKCKRFF